MKTYDVIIIGAGISGLSAGAEIYKHTQNILILEGRDRIGGRLHTQIFDDGVVYERGGELIHGTNNLVYPLVKKLGIEIQEVKKVKNDNSLSLLDRSRMLLVYLALRFNIYPKPAKDENLKAYFGRISKYLPHSFREFAEHEELDFESYERVSALHNLIKPIDSKLFFAGTATSADSGTAHGAFESGLRVAKEVLNYKAG